MAGKLKTQEVILQSPNGLVEKTVKVGNDGVVTIDSINPLEKTLFKEYIVTGSAVTSIDFTGLDINTHKSYRIEIEYYNTSASPSVMYMFINGDTTMTNYYQQEGYFYATSTTGGRQNTAQITYAVNAQYSRTTCFLSLVNSMPSATAHWVRSPLTSIETGFHGYGKTATVSNITQLTFTSSVASAIGVGSKIRIYRGDL